MDASRLALGMGRASGVGGRENPGPAHFDSRTLRSSCSCCDGGARKLKGALPGLGCPLGTLWAAAGTTQSVSLTTPFQPSQPVRYRDKAPVQQPREDKIRLACACTCGSTIQLPDKRESDTDATGHHYASEAGGRISISSRQITASLHD